MATYTLSYTGAEVNSAIGNAKDLFSTVHTWTAEQIFTNLTIQTGGLTVAEINTNEATIEYLRVEGGDAAAVFHGPATFYNEAIIDSSASLTVQGTATFAQNITVTGDVTAGSATINGETDISGDLIVTGNVNVDANGYLNVFGTANFYKDIYIQPSGAKNIYGVNQVWCREISLGSGGALGITYSGSGVASATKPGVYITTSGLTTFAIGDAIPANALVITFYN